MAQEGVIIQITLFNLKIYRNCNPKVFFKCNISVKARDRKMDISIEWPMLYYRKDLKNLHFQNFFVVVGGGG